MIFRALDLTSADGRPSFAKIMTVAVFVVGAVMGPFSSTTFALGFLLMVLAAAFGRSTLLAVINRSSVSVSHNVSEIVNRRDTAAGLEPAP